MGEQLLTLTEVVERYGVTRQTIWRWRREGIFPEPLALSSKVHRWRVRDLEAWEAGQNQQCASVQ
jgi:prophage regulatory protein